MIRTDQEWSGLVRNDQDWSGMIMTGQKWYGNFKILLIFLGMAEEILTLYNLNASLQKFSLHFYYSYLGQKASPQNEWLQNLDLQCFISEIKWISQHIKFLFQSHDISTLQGGQSIIIMILSGLIQCQVPDISNKSSFIWNMQNIRVRESVCLQLWFQRNNFCCVRCV